MAGYRPIYKRIWKDPDFQELGPLDKLIFIYLCTNEATTESGIYPITPRTISNETGIDFSTVCERLDNGFFKNVHYDQTYKLIFVRKLRKYNTGGSPDLIRKSVENDYKSYPGTCLWQHFVEEYKNDRVLMETCNGLQTVGQLFNNPSYTVNNNNNDDNKVIYGEFGNVLLYHREYRKLVDIYGEKQVEHQIESLSAYLKTKKKHYDDHYATLRNWFRREEKDAAHKGNHNPDGKSAGDTKKNTTDPNKYTTGKYGHMVRG